ncbi:MAG: LLM class flavin-dependent oxidoreductase, partial [Actinobacteria bacterium]|nr:LLM class flavin-dependent oxidoreductase [Actinomycetota bacterium]
MLPPLALSLPLTGAEPGEGIALCRDAQAWGYCSVWLSEVNGPDAFVQLGALAATTDLDLGVAVVPVQTRTAMVLGMAAVTLAQMTQGRFSLGIGASSEVIVAKWAGQPFDRPLTHVREMIEALRPILRGERATATGDYVRVDGFRPHAPPADPVPLFVGALNPRSLRQVGALADGVCLNQVGPAHVPILLEHVREGARETGRELAPDFPVMARLFCAVTDDVGAARGLVKAVFAPYIATSVYNRFYRSLGYGEEADGVAAAAAAGDRAGMAAAVSDRLVDDIFVLGDADAVTARIAEYARSGITIPAVHIMAPGAEAAAAALRDVAVRWTGAG